MYHLKSRRTQTILDQLVVSGSNFVTSIFLVRGLGLVLFGKFTIAYALILLANSIQLSFIASPMLTLAPLSASPEAKRSYLRGMFGVELIFCMAVSLVAAISAVVFLSLRPQFLGIPAAPAFVCGVVMFLLQDWLRRYYFAAGKAVASVWNDAISYVGQLFVLALLFWTHRLTVTSALWAIALTSGAAFGVGMLFERIRFNAVELKEAWKLSRGMSRDLAIANQLQWLVYQGAMLIGASVLGAEAAGSVRATQNVVGPVNVAFQAMENLVPLRAGEEMRRGGVQQAAGFLYRFGRKGFFLLLIVFLTMSFFSRDFLSFFYGRKVAVYAGILDLQMLYFLLAWPIRQFNYLFRALNRTWPILGASIVAAAASMLLIYPSVRGFNALGIMVAAVAGQVANLTFIAVAWLRIRRSYVETSSAGATLK